MAYIVRFLRIQNYITSYCYLLYCATRYIPVINTQKEKKPRRNPTVTRNPRSRVARCLNGLANCRAAPCARPSKGRKALTATVEPMQRPVSMYDSHGDVLAIKASSRHVLSLTAHVEPLPHPHTSSWPTPACRCTRPTRSSTCDRTALDARHQRHLTGCRRCGPQRHRSSDRPHGSVLSRQEHA